MKFDPKPNHYYKRNLANGHFFQDIILISPNCKTYKMVWGLDLDSKWRPITIPLLFSMGCIPKPIKFVEYSSLEELMEDMFLELM